MERRMKRLDKSTAEMKFNSDFYLKRCILAAVDDFAEISACKVKDVGKDIHVVLRVKGKLDVEKVCYEFSNYVVGVMKNKAEV